MVEGLGPEGEAKLVAQVLALRDQMVVVLANLVARSNDPEAALRIVSDSLSARVSGFRLEDDAMPFVEMIRQEHDRLVSAAGATVRQHRSTG
jgi:hypothetical protein